jgi:uncharacterized protein with von Willebrand factor type A (vWA) domain
MPSSAIVDLASDVFFSLYKAEPQQMDDPPRSRFLNNALIRLMHNAPNFASLHSNTTANIPVSMHTTVAMTNALLTDESIIEAMKLQELLDKLMEQMSKMGGQDGGQQMPDSGGGGSDSGQQDEQQQQPQQSNPKQKKLEEQIEKTQQQLQQKVDNVLGSQLGQGMVGTVIDEGHEGADEIAGVMTSWGAEAGEMSYQDANALIKIAEEKKDTLAMIAEVGGRLAGVTTETMQAVRDSYVGAPSEPTYTRDIMRMFPTERTYMSPLAPSVIRTNKISQWAQRGLLGLRPKSEGKKRGALVIAVDGSSSMNEYLCQGKVGNRSVRLAREDVSKVLATGVARAMREDRFERRRFTLFTFSSEKTDIKQTTSADSWKEMVDWVAYDPNGGTSFNAAFQYALNEMERFESEGTQGADLLFISDGEARLSGEVRDRMQAYRDRTGARVFYLQVADQSHSSHYTMDRIGLEGVVDACVVVSSADADKFDDIPTYLAEQVAQVFTQVE